jgi:hypothetical protein
MFNLIVNPSFKPHDHGKGEKGKQGRGRRGGYGDFKVYYFLSKSRHIIRKTKGIFSRLLSGKHEITLSFLLTIQDDLLKWILDFVVDIECAS